MDTVQTDAPKQHSIWSGLALPSWAACLGTASAGVMIGDARQSHRKVTLAVFLVALPVRGRAFVYFGRETLSHSWAEWPPDQPVKNICTKTAESNKVQTYGIIASCKPTSLDPTTAHGIMQSRLPQQHYYYALTLLQTEGHAFIESGPKTWNPSKPPFVGILKSAMNPKRSQAHGPVEAPAPCFWQNCVVISVILLHLKDLRRGWLTLHRTTWIFGCIVTHIGLYNGGSYVGP